MERFPAYRAFSARAMADTMASYEAAIAARKAALFARLPPSTRRVAEIGLGTGPNLQYYPRSVAEVIGIEPNEYMESYARQAAQAADVALEIRAGKAERLPLEDCSVDAVVTTLVLCTGMGKIRKRE